MTTRDYKFPSTVNALAKHSLMLKERGPALFENPPIALHDFCEVVRKREPLLFEIMLAEAENATRFASAMLETHAHTRWCSFGLPAFEVSSDMLAGLVLTDPSKVNPADVHFPFPTFTIALPRGFWSILAKDGSRDVEGVTVIVHTYESLVSNVRRPMYKDRVPLSYDSDPLRGEEIRKSIMIQMICTDGTSLWDRVTWPREETFGGWLDNSAVDYVVEGTLTADEKRLQLALRRVVINLALWIAEFGRGRKKTKGEARKKRKRKPKRAAKLAKGPGCEVWVLGHTVKLEPELVKAARADVGATNERWRLSKRVCVRGHHKRQPYGPGRKLRKWIWIKPYWRGPKDGERLAHLYKKGGSDDERA